jgi:ribonuclease R
VPPESVLDLEARDRGMSVYLANDVVPMLPHQQSKYTLSLVEGKDRLAKTVAMEFDDAGRLADYSLHYSIINVARRMTYTEVQEVLDAVDAEEPAMAGAAERLPEPVVNLLVELDALAGQLRELRVQKGSIDLDMPEYHVAVDEEGRVVGVSQLERFRSYGLVEEFMLSANRSVADFLRKNRLPGLYRIHDEPLEEDLEEFGAFIEPILGKRVNVLDRKELQNLIAEVSGTHLAEAVNMQLLRAMQRAVYSPQCKAHFALHFERYSHFTSPVRRYPDLVVHQILDQFLKENLSPARLRHDWERKLEGIAGHCNEMQERADEAEREIIKIKLLRYLQDHKDKVFEAVVTGVQEYGLFARLEDYSIEGLIKVQDIGDDFYRFDEKKKALIGTRRHREFRLGQPIKVTIEDIDMARRELDLLLYT